MAAASAALSSLSLLRGSPPSHLLLRQRRFLKWGRRASPEPSPQQPRLERATRRRLPASRLPEEARVVVCGGGAQGAAIAYALAKRGLAESTVLIDKGEFGSGSTQHSSGLVPLLKNSPVETKLSKVSKSLYAEVEQAGFYSGWDAVGSLYVAQTPERMTHFRRMKSTAVGRQVDCQLLSTDELSVAVPLMHCGDLRGGLWVPGDGVADPLEICLALVHMAKDMGVHVVPECEVLRVAVDSKKGCVEGVETDKGFVRCQNFVNSAGIWARRVATLSKPRVQLPVHAAEHYIIHCRPLETDFSNIGSLPVIRDADGRIYVRGGDRGGSLLCGGFEERSRPAYERDHSVVSPPDWDHAHPQLESLIKRFPCLENAIYEDLTNDPEPYSPDTEWIIGQAPEIRNYFVAAGMRSSGVGSAGGVAELIADFVTKGRTFVDTHNLDIQRFLPLHNNRKFLRDRVQEIPGTLKAIPYPYKEYQTGRALRTSPIFTKLRDSGARFNQVMGYERTMYVEPEDEGSSMGGGIQAMLSREKREPSSLTMSKPLTFFKPSWFDVVQQEFTASRETCSLSDFTSFAKMMVWSNRTEDVVNYLERLCSNHADFPVGSVTYSGMQNVDGGYENDCTVARVEENRYLLMSPSIQQMRSYAWMKWHLPEDGSVLLEDVTSLYTTLCLMGPNSESVMAKVVAPDELDRLQSMKPFSVTDLDIGHVPHVLTINTTPTGERGYILYIPNECANNVYDWVMREGAAFGIRHCGYYAVHALRIEKFYGFWGQDLDSRSTPLECGRHFRTKTDSDKDFIGKDALLRQLRPESEGGGVHKMLVMLVLDDYDHETDPWPWGGEPIFRDGRYAGSVTTASYGFSLRKMLAIGFVHNFEEGDDDERTTRPVTKEWVLSGKYEIEIACQRFPVDVKLNSPAIPKTVSMTRHE